VKHIIVPNFFSQPEEMRSAFESTVPTTARNGGSDRRLWDYFYIPNLYTYLRARPEAVFPEELVSAFVDELTRWSLEHLGLGYVRFPTLSMYVNGCGQGLHNDARQGRMAYVYSLTRWDERKFSGGETALMLDADYWHSEKITRSSAEQSLVEYVPAVFNQLLVFDDRVLHGVSHVQGTMDPLHSRLVLHGHLREAGISVRGAHAARDLEVVWHDNVPRLERALESFDGAYDGIVTVRMSIGPDGAVTDCRVLLDTLVATARNVDSPARIAETLLSWCRSLELPPAAGSSSVSVPFAMSSL
jgi:hypothetical protein